MDVERVWQGGIDEDRARDCGGRCRREDFCDIELANSLPQRERGSTHDCRARIQGKRLRGSTGEHSPVGSSPSAEEVEGKS